MLLELDQILNVEIYHPVHFVVEKSFGQAYAYSQLDQTYTSFILRVLVIENTIKILSNSSIRSELKLHSLSRLVTLN